MQTYLLKKSQVIILHNNEYTIHIVEYQIFSM